MARRASSDSRRQPILCAVLDVAALGPSPELRAQALFRAGVDWIQLRDRDVEAALLFQTATALVRARDVSLRDVSLRDVSLREVSLRDVDRDPERVAPRVIVNRRIDVALASGADGIHLGFDALEPVQARALLGENALLGASLHTADEVVAAARGGFQWGRALPESALCSYVHLAPIWDPRSKPASRPALGPAELERACASGLPVLAQGGVDPARAARAVAAGAAGIAVTGLLSHAADPTRAASLLRRALDREQR